MLGLAIAAAYANAVTIPFHFDDWHAVEQNPHIRSLANLPRFFVDPDTTTILHENKDLRPIVVATLALDYAISGPATWSYHATNILFHWLVVLLVFRIVRDHCWLGARALPVALAAALVVALHPLNTEPVNYVSSRSSLLTALFYLGAFDAAARDRRVASAGLLALAMLTKAIAVTFPVVFLGYCLLGRPRRVPWGFLAALVAVAAAGILYRQLLLPPWVVASARQPWVTPWIYFLTEWSAYLYYLRLFVWPDALVIDRLDYPYARSILEPQAWASLLGLITLGALAWRVRRHEPALAFAAFWYFVTLFAESSFFPLAEPVNEHRPYLAMLGLGLAAGIALDTVATRAARRASVPAHRTFAVLLLLTAGVLGTGTVLRNRTWQTARALWMDATRKAPGNTRAWLNAGRALMVAGDDAGARTLFLEAHRLSPCYAYVQMNLSVIDARAGDAEGALRWADEAVHCNGGLALAHFYRGSALERLGRTADAIAAYRRATAIDGQHADAWLAQGRLLEAQRDWSNAALAYDHALAANPTSVAAAMGAGLLYQHRLGKSAEAVERFRAALRLDPDHYGAHYQLAVALLATGDRDGAVATWREFVAMAAAIGDRKSIAGAPAALRDAADIR